MKFLLPWKEYQGAHINDTVYRLYDPHDEEVATISIRASNIFRLQIYVPYNGIREYNFSSVEEAKKISIEICTKLGYRFVSDKFINLL